ncbi:nitrous oxide reductase family maturation protein NosD [Aurantimonas sp. HBX-1]|uniref:nitrous oxide reductase family maturation protein NosD n=1 Tax=Aurantimonas sp. HBX-1 TaxID=2906072 RepID=UPI00351D29EF
MVARLVMIIVGMAALIAAMPGAPAWGDVIQLAPGAGLQAAIDAASPGDVIRLSAGRHDGPVTLAKTLTLEGEAGAIVAGSGSGSVITVSAPGSVVRGLQITGSGRSLPDMDSGVFVAQSASGTRVEENEILNNLVGIYLHGAENSLARGNRIVGLREGRTSEAGDGISLWNAPGAQVIGNDVSFGRDGIFTKTSKDNVFRANHFRNLRFAVHYMYTNDSEVSDNVSTNNSVGYAIMYSRNLRIAGNVSDGDRDHGLMLNYANGSVITENTVRGRMLPANRWTAAGRVRGAHAAPGAALDDRAAEEDGMRLGPEKCVFIYNANKNEFHDNLFEGCSIGIHFTAGSEGNAISGNAFVRNRIQVKYVGTRDLDWSAEGRGNYWSDNPAFDLDGDGIGDNPYRPNDLVDQVLWTSPQAKVLMNSPAVQVLRWAQTQFPALLPGGVVDSRPLMAPPARSIGHD